MIERIFKLLKEKNITAKELSTAINISAGNISDWKKGKSKPSTDAISKIADYFDVSTDYLLGKTDIPDKKHYEYLDKGNIAFYQGYKGLSDEGKEKLDAFLKFLIEDEKKNK